MQTKEYQTNKNTRDAIPLPQHPPHNNGHGITTNQGIKQLTLKIKILTNKKTVVQLWRRTQRAFVIRKTKIIESNRARNIIRGKPNKSQKLNNVRQNETRHEKHQNSRGETKTLSKPTPTRRVTSKRAVTKRQYLYSRKQTEKKNHKMQNIVGGGGCQIYAKTQKFRATKALTN